MILFTLLLTVFLLPGTSIIGMDAASSGDDAARSHRYKRRENTVAAAELERDIAPRDPKQRPLRVEAALSAETITTEGGSPVSPESTTAINSWIKRLLANPSHYLEDNFDPVSSRSAISYRRRHLVPSNHPSDDQFYASEILKDLDNVYARFLVAVYKLTSSFSYTAPASDEWWPCDAPQSADHPLRILQTLATDNRLPEAWNLLSLIYKGLPADKRDTWFNREAFHKHQQNCTRVISEYPKKEQENIMQEIKKEQKWFDWYAQKYLSHQQSCREKETE